MGINRGKAMTGTDIDISHKASIKGGWTDQTPRCKDGDVVEKLKLKIDNGEALLEIHKIKLGDPPTLLKKIERKFESPTATLLTGPQVPGTDTGWGETKRWKDPPLERDLKEKGKSNTEFKSVNSNVSKNSSIGVEKGDFAEYRLSVDLTNVSDGINVTAKNVSERYEVSKKNNTSGQVSLLQSFKRNGSTVESELETNAFTQKGDIRGIVVPSNLSKGDKIPENGTVTGMANGNQKVEITYTPGNVTTNAVYNRSKGLLLELNSTSPKGNFSMEAVDTSLSENPPSERYDKNDDEEIDGEEVRTAIKDFLFNNKLTGPQIQEIIKNFLF